MRNVLYLLFLLATMLSATCLCAEDEAAKTPAADKPADIDEQATHEQAAIIEISQGSDDNLKVNAFCMGEDGQIFACCGSGPGEIRVFSSSGELQNSWKISVKPESANVTPNGTLLVGGSGKLFQFTTDGKKLLELESPHAAAVRDGKEKIREQAIANLKMMANSLESRIKMYTKMIDQLEEKKKAGKITKDEERVLGFLPASLARMLELQQNRPQKKKEELSEEVNELLPKSGG